MNLSWAYSPASVSLQRTPGPIANYQAGVRSDGGDVVAPNNTNDLYNRLVNLGLFNSASLINSCNGFKVGELYNFVPTPVASFDAFTVTRASTKNVLGSNGLYQSVANNVPAFEFNADGTYRGLLVEPGATNILQRSQEFDNAYWSKVASSVTANASTAPDGTTTADKLIPDTANSQHRLDVTSTSTAVEHTFSVFAKADGYTIVSLRAGSRAACFSLNTGATSFVEASTTASAVQLPNGWWRVSITGVLGVNSICRINVENVAGIGGAFAGDGTSGVLLWQAQLETGSVASSYIVTTGSTATRSADSISLTSASSLIGQTEGAIYAEFEIRAGSATRTIFALSDNTTSNRVRLRRVSATQYTAERNLTSSADITSSISGVTENIVLKTAVAYSSATDGFVLYVNGTGATPSTGAMFSGQLTDVDLGSLQDGTNQINGWIRAFAIYTTRLSNAQLTSLTT